MIELTAVTGFDWDDGNARKSEDKHCISQTEAEQVFFNDPLLLMDDVRHSGTEQRHHALGRTNDGVMLHITFTMRATLIRIISARAMSRKEREFYEKAS